MHYFSTDIELQGSKWKKKILTVSYGYKELETSNPLKQGSNEVEFFDGSGRVCKTGCT